MLGLYKPIHKLSLFALEFGFTWETGHRSKPTIRNRVSPRILKFTDTSKYRPIAASAWETAFRSLANVFLVLISTIALGSATAGGQPFGKNANADSVELVVLGIAQDAGYPQAGCQKQCCKPAWHDFRLRRHVTCLGLIDHQSGQRWLIECTPDFPDQLRLLDEICAHGDRKRSPDEPLLDGIFLTHAHIGHYAGLVHLGREVMGAKNVSTYAMPRMDRFLRQNGPWSQLVNLKNIALRPMQANRTVQLNKRLTITPFQVPHRDEFSETVGFKIVGPKKTVVFLPDIDKWSKWDHSIEALVKQADLAYLDGTFFANGEIPGRDMALIPHPFVAESIKQFSALDETERKKVRFIHFNHTNPVLQRQSDAQRQIELAGMAVAVQGERVELNSQK